MSEELQKWFRLRMFLRFEVLKADMPEWQARDVGSLLALLSEEANQLKNAIAGQKGSSAIIDEAADVAVVAMLIAEQIRKSKRVAK